MKRLSHRLLFVLLVLLSATRGTAAIQPACYKLAAQYEAGHEPAAAALVRGLRFAELHGLSAQVLEVGPKEDRRTRVFIGLDATNKELHDAYLKEFQLTSQEPGLGGLLAVEFAHEIENQYVIGGLRRDDTGDFYRWGTRNRSGQDLAYVRKYMMTGNKPIIGFANVIGLTEAQAKNVDVYLNEPTKRAACKSDNCIAWVSSIELDKTETEATDAERNFLFSHLGVSRASAHFEISRRLIHAANANHGLVFVLYNGEAGRQAFDTNLQSYIPPDPKIPYATIIRDFKVENKALSTALGAIPDGGKVFFPIAAGASPEAFAELINKAKESTKGFDVHVLVNGISETEFRRGVETAEGKFRMHALFLGGNMRKLYSEKKLSYIPGNLSDFTRWMGEGDQRFQYDAVVVRVAPPDAEGRYSLGPNHDHVMTIIKNNPNVKVIAEVNANVPRTNGDNFLTEEQIASKFTSTTELAGPPVVPLTDVEIEIGKHLGRLVVDGATLQLGIGNVFGGLPAGLKAAGVKKLAVRTEMFGDPLKEVMEAGIADKAVVGFAYGSGNLYKWLDGNQAVKFEATEIVNDPGKISKIKKFHAINTALQVNLSGESNATMGPTGRISSPGGQVEFMTGGARSAGGKGIIAIRSTAKGGELSTIVLDFYKGPITTPHEFVTHVVTEYGTAELKGANERERAINLINVAHPKFRQSLTDEAVGRGLLSEGDRGAINLAQAPMP